MLEFSRFKIVIVLLVCSWAFWMALPNALSTEARASLASILPEKSVKLGLDLQGGVHLLLDVDFDSYLDEKIDTLVETAREKLTSERIRYVPPFKTSKTGIDFGLRDAAKDGDKVKELFRDIYQEAGVEISETGKVSIRYREEAIKEMKTDIVNRSIEIVRRRVDETGTLEPIIQRQGDTRIILQVPGLTDSGPLKDKLKSTAKMSFHLMDTTNPYPNRKITPPRGTMLLTGQDEKRISYYLVKKPVLIGGENLEDARAAFDQQTGQPIITFRFDGYGAKKFAQITRENVGKPFAIVLDKQVVTAPNINEPITGGRGQISGRFDLAEAQNTALLLRAGALPAPLTFLEERTVGPSLGQDSIDAGMAAAGLGIVLVLVLMFLFYGLFGLFANIALVINILLVVAVLSLFQATLTLPGIAGLVLTMGMAVDANVLIFERIKEETRHGKTPYAAIDHGFGQAFKTILDSNFTTIIATLMLYIYGTGPVKGFAVTLSVGILCSMFSAILFTRMLIIIWLRRTKPNKLAL
jgi:preprotein translocase subunit SecD